MLVDHIKRVSEGDELSAERDGQILDVLGRRCTHDDMIGDSLGMHIPKRIPKGLRWFETDGALTYPDDRTQPPYADAVQRVFHNNYLDTYGPVAGPTTRVYLPGAVADQATGYYIGRPKLWAGNYLPALYNFQSDRWEVPFWINLPWWAKAQADWQEGGTYPAGEPYVMVKVCDRDGTGVTGDEIRIELPRNPRPADLNDSEHEADPAVYEDWVISCQLHDDGCFVCRSPYLHMRKIGAIRMIHDDSSIPTGWAKCDGTQKTGAAGTFNLLNFVKNFDGTDYGCHPRYPISGESIGDQKKNVWFDTLGVEPTKRNAGDDAGSGAFISDSAAGGNPINGVNRSAYDIDGTAHDVALYLWSSDGEDFDTIVWFMQRWK